MGTLLGFGIGLLIGILICGKFPPLALKIHDLAYNWKDKVSDLMGQYNEQMKALEGAGHIRSNNEPKIAEDKLDQLDKDILNSQKGGIDKE